MKRTLVSLLAFAAMGASLQAAPRTLSEAQAFAQQFLSKEIGQPVKLTTLNQRTLAPGLAETVSQPFYAFNDETNQAFVIVSGSDLMRPVIGYSTAGTLPSDVNSLPDNVQSWFEWLGQTADYLEQHPEAALTAQQKSQTFEPVSPLMKSKWGQDSPYNAQCPSGCPTGCVATATAQVFRYHFAKLGEVVQGIGTHSYTYKNKTRSVDYSANTYDYSLMPLSGRNATSAQKSELAKLSYHVGVGVDMHYDTGGSGTFTNFVPRLAVDNFGFNSLTSSVSRVLFSYDEWISMLNEELYNERPIVFGGQSSSGGHAFVLEGLDADGLYYVNWGWDGYYNGYFDVTVLNSGETGTGASPSDDGFCMQQEAILNLCYDEGAGRYYTPMQIGSYSFSSSKSSVSLGQSVTITALNVVNFSNIPQKGYIGLLLMQGDQEIQRVESSTRVSANAGHDGSYYGTGQVKRTITFDSSLPDGTYQLWMYYQPDGKEYFDYLRTTHTRSSYFTVTVENGSVKVFRPAESIPVVPSNWTWENEQIETRPTSICCDLYNPSDESFVAQYQITFIDPDGQRSKPVNHGQVVVVGPGETKTIGFDYHFMKAGHWRTELDVIRQNFSEDPDPFEAGDGEFDVILNETQGASFKLTKTLEQVTDTVRINCEATFRLKLHNSGAPYNGQMGIRFYKKSSGGDPLCEFYNDATCEGDADLTIEVSGLVTNALKEKTVYYARAAYLFGDNYQTFETKSGASNSIAVRVWPEPENNNGIAEITVDEPDDLTHAQIFNLVGKRISLPASGQLPRGIYIINGKKTVIK